MAVDLVVLQEIPKFFEGFDCPKLGVDGSCGGRGLAAEDDGLFEAVEVEEFSGGGVELDGDELEGIGAHVN